MAANQTKGQLDVLVLSVVQHRPGHGYEIIAALRELSGGEFDLPEGTVYPRLHRLEAQGLLESEWRSVNDRRRRIYRLTDSGLAALAEGRAEWQRFAIGMRSVLGATR